MGDIALNAPYHLYADDEQLYHYFKADQEDSMSNAIANIQNYVKVTVFGWF